MPEPPTIVLKHLCPSMLFLTHATTSFIVLLFLSPSRMFSDLLAKQTSVLDSSCCALTSKPLSHPLGQAKSATTAWRVLCPLVQSRHRGNHFARNARLRIAPISLYRRDQNASSAFLTASAINLVRFVTWQAGVPHAKTRTSRFAALKAS